MKKFRLKRLFLILFSFILLVAVANAAEETGSFTWEQPYIDGDIDLNFGAVDGWRIYMSDTPSVYGTTAIITMPYDGTVAPSYSSSYVLTLTGAGTKYFVVRSYNQYGEAGNSNEIDFPYNYSVPSTSVNLTFTISTP